MECRSAEEAIEAAQAGADIVMLDNFDSQVENILRLLLVSVFFSVNCMGFVMLLHCFK